MPVVGQSARRTRRVTLKDIELFTELTVGQDYAGT